MKNLYLSFNTFPWWIVPVLAFLLIFFLFLLLLKERSRKTEHKDEIKKAQPKDTEIDIEPAVEEAVTTWTVNLDNEIRARAYELSRQHNGLGDYREQDWNNAVREISALYTACGHSVFNDGECWWASRSYSF